MSAPAPLLLFVPGLACRLAIRPDLAKNLSTLIEQGTFTPLFPGFPALPAPILTTLRTGRWPGEHGVLHGPAEPAGFCVLSSFELACRERDPRDPSLAESFRALDAEIGSLADAHEGNVIVLSDGALWPAAASIDIDAALRDRFGEAVESRTEEQVSFIRTASISETARFIQSLDRGVRVLCSVAERAAYRIDHPNAGDLIAIAPPNRRFGTSGPRVTRGQLPLQIEDYGVLISSQPLAWAEGRRFLLATEAGRGLMAEEAV